MIAIDNKNGISTDESLLGRYIPLSTGSRLPDSPRSYSTTIQSGFMLSTLLPASGCSGNVNRVAQALVKTDSPAADPVGIAAVPESLKRTDQWVVFQTEYDPDKQKVRKNPLHKAVCNDASTWMSFDRACSLAQPDQIVTYALPVDEPVGDAVVAIDLDGCIENGSLDPAYGTIVSMFSGTYIERSVSGKGLHIMVSGKTGLRPNSKVELRDRVLPVEIYTNRRFICMTGDRFEGSGPEIVPMQDSLDLLEQLCAGRPAARPEISEARTGVASEQLPDPNSDATLRKLKNALGFLDPSNYADWFRYGIALKRWGDVNERGDEVYALFDEWSQQTQDNNYDPEGNRRKWESWECSAGDRQVTVGTIFHDAQQEGYKYPKSGVLFYGTAHIDSETGESAPPPASVPNPAPNKARRYLPKVQVPSAGHSFIDCSEQIFGLMAESEEYFLRGGAACEINKGALSTLTPSAFRSRVEEIGSLYTVVKHKENEYLEKPIRLSMDSAKTILEAKAVALLPPIELVTAASVLVRTPDGQVVRAEKGYCREAELFVNGDYSGIRISAEEAAVEIENLFQDYRFIGPGDKTRAIAFVVSIALRIGQFYKDRPCPMFVVEADTSQAGKGYMIDVISSIYKERASMVAESKGGVGSFDESFQKVLEFGRPIVCLDNVRGRIASTYIESAITAPDKFWVRLPGRAAIAVDPRRFVYCATSNGMESTQDLSNRSLVIRILKQPLDHVFKRWPEGNLKEHVFHNSDRFLAGIHAIIMKWHELGEPLPDVTGHDFRDWHRITQGVINVGWPHLGNLIDEEHREVQNRIADPKQVWIREVCKVAQPGRYYVATELVELCEEKGIVIPRTKKDDDTQKKAKQVGCHLAGILDSTHRTVIDETRIDRHSTPERRRDGKGSYERKTYRFVPKSLLGAPCYPWDLTGEGFLPPSNPQ